LRQFSRYNAAVMKISKQELRALTDSRSWERGVGYFERGYVLSIFEDGDVITAKVSGSRDYRVRLWLRDGKVDGTCSCPMGDSGVFCKHCVAVGLTYLNGGVDGGEKEESEGSKDSITAADIRKYLGGREKESLVEIIMEQLADDDALQRRLMLKTALSVKGGGNADALKAAIRQATNTRGGVDYYCAGDFCRGIDEVLDSVEELLKEGGAEQVIELAEYGLKRAEKALGNMDDSDGFMQDVFERLGELHHEACVKAKPDPEKLAKRLFKWELTSDWETFHGAAESYADVLGRQGIEVYRKLVQAEWKKLPPIKPGERDSGYRHDRFVITSMMEALARQSGDVEELAAVKSKDLSSPYSFLQIARVYQDAGQTDKALEWAERGLREFADRGDSRLNEFVANMYHRRRRHEEAMKLIWSDFTRNAELSSYQCLKQHADKYGRWDEWRTRALKHIRDVISNVSSRVKANGISGMYYRNGDNSLLVEIFLWEQDIEAAWAEATAGGCNQSLWSRLADLRAEAHPSESAEVYRRLVGSVLKQTNNSAYRDAVKLIKQIRTLMTEAGESKEFEQYIAGVRGEYKRKRNFMAMLDRSGLRAT